MQRKEKTFKGQKIFIGIDVHKNSWSVAVAPEVGTFKAHVQKPSAQALFDFLHKNYPDGEYIAVYESGFTGFSTYYELRDVGINCIVAHAADVPTSQYEEAMKTDRIDARKLARALRAGQLRGIYVHSKDDIAARSLLRLRKTMRKELGTYKARVKHKLYNNGVAIPENFASPASRWSRAFMKWLREDVALMSSSRDDLDLLLEQIDTYDATLSKVSKKIDELSQSERYKHDFDLLTSIPGIGTYVAMTLLTEIGDFRRFSNEKQFASYLGLIPTSHSSGDKIIHGEMTFRGNKKIGPMIIETAWVSISSDHGLGETYLSYKKRMKPQLAIVRIARKLSNIMFSVIKTDRKYVPYNA